MAATRDGRVRGGGVRRHRDPGRWRLLFFKFQRPDWALGEVAALWLSILALIVGLAPLSARGSLALVPYLLWVSFAAVLNRTIVRLNQPFGRVAVSQ